jgi:aminoglycoside phosphotransferase (APT) family kinase protein
MAKLESRLGFGVDNVREAPNVIGDGEEKMKKQNFALLLGWLEKQKTSMTKSEDVDLRRQVDACLDLLRTLHKHDPSALPTPVRTAWERLLGPEEF